jgi:hypothetical protein
MGVAFIERRLSLLILFIIFYSYFSCSGYRTYRQLVPGVIGTNVLRFCSIGENVSSPDPSKRSISVKSTSKTPIVLQPFQVTTISCLAAVLYQEQDGLERVICYASRGLRASEKNYPAHNLQF